MIPIRSASVVGLTQIWLKYSQDGIYPDPLPGGFNGNTHIAETLANAKSVKVLNLVGLFRRLILVSRVISHRSNVVGSDP